jgi:O-antigen/teichoic acid export membrane protein
LSFIFLKRTFPDLTNRQKVFKFEAKKILGFSWPLAFVGFFNVVMFQINTIMLGYFSTSQDIGIFGAVQRTSFAIQIIQASFNPIFAPIVADLFNRRKFSELESYFKIITNWVFMISFPLFIFLMVFPRELLNVWGSGYMAGWPSLMIISISMIINCSLGPVKNMIMMTGRSRLNLLNDGLSFLLAVVLNIILIPRYGVLGASISFASAVFVVNIMGFIEVYLILKIHPYKRSILKPMTAGVMIFAAIFMIKRYIFAGSIGIIWLIILMLLSLGLYAGLLILFRLNQEDRVVLAMIARRLRGRKSPL